MLGVKRDAETVVDSVLVALEEMVAETDQEIVMDRICDTVRLLEIAADSVTVTE
jgi:hypothetical protein